MTKSYGTDPTPGWHEPGLLIPDEAWHAALYALEDVYKRRGTGVLECETTGPVVRAVAPYIVAAELRRWADLLRFKSGLITDDEIVTSTIELLYRRASELDGAR